jgi:hypothetical protein
LFDELLWNYIKSFILKQTCIYGNCSHPGVVLAAATLIPGQGRFGYMCVLCFDDYMLFRPQHQKKLYDRIRSEVSTKVIGIAPLRQQIKALSDKNLMRLLNIPKTIRNMRPLRSTLSHVFLYKIPQEEEEARRERLKSIMKLAQMKHVNR